MGKLLKILAAVVGVLLLLIVAAVIIIPLVVDPNDYKDEIVTKVKEATGRDLKIQGDIGLSVFPWLGLELGAVELSNAKGFGDAPFAAVTEAAVRVKIKPLLDKRLEADTVTLKGLRLNLAKAKDGRTNWDDLTAAGKPAEPKAEKKAKTTPGGAPLAALAIGGVAITDARLSWQDEVSGQHFVVEQLNLETGTVIPGRPVDLKLAFQVDSKAPALRAKIQLNGSPSLDLDRQRLDIEKLVLELDAQGEALQGKSLQARLQTGVALDLAKMNLSLDGLQLTAADLALSGGLKGINLAQAPAFSGDLKLAEFDLRGWMESQGLPVPETADPKALTRVGLSVVLAGTDKEVELDKLALVLDDSRLDGQVKVRDFAAPAIGFNLAVDAIDLDRYLPPPVEEGDEAAQADASKTASKTAAGPEQELLPVETLRQLNLDGVFRVGKLKVKKLQMQDAEVSVKARNGHILVGQQIKQFYDGSLQGKTVIDVRGKEPLLQLEENLNGVQAGPLLKDYMGEDKLTGEGRFQAKLNTRGNTDSVMRKNLGGDLSLRFENGAVKGVNVAEVIRENWAKVQGQPVETSNEPQQTDFSELSGSAKITKGVLVNRDLMAKSPLLRIDGKGQVDLVKEMMDYTLTTTIVGSLEGQGGKEMTDLKGAPIPVRLAGPLADPKASVNMEELAQRMAKTKAKEKVDEKIKEKLGDKVPPQLQDKLKGLFR